MRRLHVALVVALLAGSLVAGPAASGPDVRASVSAEGVVLSNGVVERRWAPGRLVTTRLADLRSGGAVLEGPEPDLALAIGGLPVPVGELPARAEAEALPDGTGRIIFTVTLPGLLEIVRTVEAYPGVAGFRSATTLRSTVPLALSGYELDRVPAPGAAPTIHQFRAGADWRYDEGWEPELVVGDHQPGPWRVSSGAGPGEPLDAAAQWLSLALPDGQRVFTTMARNNYHSSRAAYDGEVGTTLVDFSRDIVYYGPIEESVHTSNPTGGPARQRIVMPLRAVPLETVFTGFGLDADDETWQHYRYLDHQIAWPKRVAFNTDKVDRNDRSTGAKDDIDFERFGPLADAAEQMGVELFVFDDGWQAISGDWCPDSPSCPEPRWDGSSDSMFRPRFPDDSFAAVRERLSAGGMDLGLWFTPMEFHPAAEAYRRNPQWACAPVGHATAGLSVVQPDSGSNEAGIGVWNPEALGVHPDTGEPMKLVDYIEDRVRRAVVEWESTFFKFDFLAFIDCAGAEPVDLYAYQESFAAMVERLRADFPEVPFGIDETNDYRMFPRSVPYGPSWFQNGSPRSEQLLHNIWNLAPFVPGFYLGQHALGNSGERDERGVDYLMSVALPSAITFWLEIDTSLTPGQRAQVRRWTDFYKAHRDDLATFAYPLLDDPLDGGWTALQPWDPEAGRGFLLAWRQAGAEATTSIPLRGVPAGRTFELVAHDPATGATTPLGTASSADLSSGLDVTIPAPYGYAIIQITPS